MSRQYWKHEVCICVQIICAASDSDKQLKLFHYPSTSVFNYRCPKLERHFHNGVAWRRWIEPPHADIDSSTLPPVGVSRRLRGNSVFSQKWGAKEGMRRKEVRLGHNLDWKHKEGLLGAGSADSVVLATIHHFQHLPVRGVHQRPCAFCLSTTLWMKELAKAQFQLFIAHKPSRWGGKKRGMKSERVCARGECVCLAWFKSSQLCFSNQILKTWGSLVSSIHPITTTNVHSSCVFPPSADAMSLSSIRPLTTYPPHPPDHHHHMPRTSDEGRNRI